MLIDNMDTNIVEVKSEDLINGNEIINTRLIVNSEDPIYLIRVDGKDSYYTYTLHSGKKVAHLLAEMKMTEIAKPMTPSYKREMEETHKVMTASGINKESEGLKIKVYSQSLGYYLYNSKPVCVQIIEVIPISYLGYN